MKHGVLERKRDGNFEKNKKSYDSSDVWCEAIRSKKQRGVHGHVGIKESLDRIAKASSMRWYGHVFRKEDENVIVKALKFEVNGSRGRGRPKQTWKKQVENEIKKNRLCKKQRWSPRGHILKSLASKVKFLALASRPQVLENWPVLGSRTALFFELLKYCGALEKFYGKRFFVEIA